MLNSTESIADGGKAEFGIKHANPSVVLPKPQLNALQVLWLRETGVDIFWGKAWPGLCAPASKQSKANVGLSGPADKDASSNSALKVKSVPVNPSASNQVKEAGKTLSNREVALSILNKTPTSAKTANKQTQTATEAEVNSAFNMRANLQNLSWQQLQQVALCCQACDLHNYRSTTVFANQRPADNPHSDLLFILQAPGSEDDLQGYPLSGEEGDLFNNMLAAIGRQREQVVVTPLVKCRSPLGDVPNQQQRTQCRKFLIAQLQLVQPQCIVMLGAVAKDLLDLDGVVEDWRMQDLYFEYHNKRYPVIVTYHPYYLLIDQTLKAKAWQDLKKIVNFIS